MGACEFMEVGVGTDPEKVFDALHQQALWDHGHAGYTGTIGEKPGHVLFGEVPAGVTLQALENAVYDAEGSTQYVDGKWVEVPGDIETLEKMFPGKSKQIVSTYFDKWGPAVGFKTSDGFVFMGLASC